VSSLRYLWGMKRSHVPMRPAALFVFPLALVLVLGCGARTRLGAVWSAQEPGPKPLTNILVVGIGAEAAPRRVFEDQLASALVARGNQAVASYRLLPSEEMLAQADLAGVVERGGHDAVAVTRLVAVDQEERVVPPRSGVSFGMGSGGYYGHYGTSWGINYSPGYVTHSTTVHLETRLFQVAGGGLVWTAESDTFDPGSVEDVVQSVSQALVARLADDGWIR